jgi:predicted RNA-binding protein with RPS1 domain
VILISKSVNVKANGMVMLSILLFMFMTGQFGIEFNTIQSEKEKDSAAFAYVDSIIKDMLQDKKPQAVEFDNEEYGDYWVMLKQIDEAYVEFYNSKAQYVDLCIKLAANVNDNAAAKKNITEILANLENYELNYNRFLENFKDAIENSNIPTNQKEKMLKNYYASLEKSRGFYKEYFNIAKNAYTLYDKLVQYRIINNALFSKNYNSFIFNVQEKADKYNSMQSELNKWINEEKEWIKKRDSKRKEIINSISKS